MVPTQTIDFLGERTRFGPFARSLVTIWLLQSPGQDRQAVTFSSPDDDTSRFTILYIILFFDTDVTSLPVAKQSKQHRQGRYLLYKGFLILLFNTKWKQNKSQNPPITLHWPTFCRVNEYFLSSCSKSCQHSLGKSIRPTYLTTFWFPQQTRPMQRGHTHQHAGTQWHPHTPSTRNSSNLTLT